MNLDCSFNLVFLRFLRYFLVSLVYFTADRFGFYRAASLLNLRHLLGLGFRCP